MPYFNECPHCHAHLDPGEECDCMEHKNAKASVSKQTSKPPIHISSKQVSNTKAHYDHRHEAAR